MTKFVCRYGHVHRSEQATRFCIAETTWRRKISQIALTPWEYAGSCDEWFEHNGWRNWFWSATADYIMLRDKHCQFEGCILQTKLEVHHIIPRRLGGSEHPKNLITLCQGHHSLQPAHHYDAPLVLSDAELAKFKLMLHMQKPVKNRDPLQRPLFPEETKSK